MARISARITDELLAATDAARGDVPREVWVRRALEEKNATAEPVRPQSRTRLPVTFEQALGLVDTGHGLYPKGTDHTKPARPRRAAQVKADVEPIPRAKGKR